MVGIAFMAEVVAPHCFAVGWVRTPICVRNPTTSIITRGLLGYDQQRGWSNPTYETRANLTKITWSENPI